MKRRHPLQLEHLETRETPDVSFRPETLLSALAAEHRVAETRALAPLVPPAEGTHLGGLIPPAHVDAFFSDPRALERYFSPLSPTVGPDEPRASAWRDPVSADLDQQGWSFLCNYTRKAIRGDEARRGPLPDHEDVVQQVYLEWRLEVGANEDALSHLLDEESPERQVLRQNVSRVIARARYQHSRQQSFQELEDVAAPSRANAQELIDWHIDRESGAAGLSRRERRIVELRLEGATFEEIGREVGLPKQRVCEAFNTALVRLRRIYAEAA